MKAVVGVLALQGDFEAHAKALAKCGVEARDVRVPSAIEGLQGLVIPGGESTTLLHLLRESHLEELIPRFVGDGGALYGTCAGAILLAHQVTSPAQFSFDLIDIDVERNAYGRQIDSFEAVLTDVAREVMSRGDADTGPGGRDRLPGEGDTLPAVFIRAPRIRRVGPGVDVLASREGEPVLVRQSRVLVSTFHPELTGDTRVHRYFLDSVVAAERAARTA